MKPRASLLALSLASALFGCASPTHHVRYMSSRRAPRAEACTADTLQVHTDHGPDEPREAFAVVTAECGENKEAECRQQLILGGCEVGADALIDVESRVSRDRRRMVGTAVEYVHDGTPARSSGGVISR